MSLSALAFSGLLVIAAPNSLTFKKINPDSVVRISQVDCDMYSASTISATMKNGKKIRLLYDKEARFDPRSLIDQKSWFSIGNPYDRENYDHSCIYLVCSLKLGMCKCCEVLADPGYKWFLLDDTGSVMVDERSYGGRSAELRDTLPDRTLSEAEMVKRFLAAPPEPFKSKIHAARKKR